MDTINKNNDDTYKRMQELLADYVFNRATEEEHNFFEQNIGNYPDIQQEIKQVKEVFNKVEAMDLNSIVAQRTRNLSIKVNNRLKSKSKRERQFGFVYKYLVPTLGLAILLIFFFTGKDIFNTQINKNEVNSEYSVLSPKDATIIMEKTDSASIEAVSDELAQVVNTYNHYTPKTDETNIESVWNDYLASSLLNAESDISKNFPYLIQFKYDLTKEMDNIDENEFQNILKEFDDVDFNS